MIKYELGKTVFNKYGGHYTELKTTRNKKKVKELLNQEWFIIEKKIIIYTPLKKWWKKLSNGNKITLIGIVLTTLTWGLTEWFSYKKENLNNKIVFLESKIDSLNILTVSLNNYVDSLSKQSLYMNYKIVECNEMNEKLKKELTTKK